MLGSRVKFSPLKSCLLFEKTEILSKTYSLIITVALVTTAGCTGLAEKPQLAADSGVINSGDKSSEQYSVILSELPIMQSGESGATGNVVFKAGYLYSSAAGLTCKTVTLSKSFDVSDTKNRVACDNGKNWFFISDVFQADDNEVDNKVMEIEMVNTAVGSLK